MRFPRPSTPNNQRSAADRLASWAGWILLIFGAGLIGLATALADKPAVAPIFAIGGVALIVMGVLLPRLEGQLEFGASGFKVFLAELREQTRGLEADAKAIILDEVVEVTSRAVSPETARRLVSDVVARAQRSLALEHAFARWLVEQGWSIVEDAGLVLQHPTEFDIVAKRGPEWLVVEARASLGSMDDAASVAALAARALRLRDRHAFDVGDRIQAALVVGEMPDALLVNRLRHEGIDLYLEDQQGFARVGAT